MAPIQVKAESREAISTLIDKLINDNDVMIFSKSWCPFCKKVRSLSLTSLPQASIR